MDRDTTGALTEQQEEWAHLHGYDELIVKTKNKFYTMRATLDHLRFDVIKFEPAPFGQDGIEGLSGASSSARIP